MASLLYSIVNSINGFTKFKEFKILSKSLGLILFSSNGVSQSLRKQLEFRESPKTATTMPLDAMGKLHTKQFYLENYLGNAA